MCKSIDTLKRQEMQESKKFKSLMDTGIITVNDYAKRAERRRWYEAQFEHYQNQIKQLETP